MNDATSYFNGPRGRLAYRKIEGDGPCVVWLGGFRSDMTGTKAAHISQWAQKRARSFLRFDYSGHGESDGAFEDGCLSDWIDDARAIIDAQTSGALILVGSSMGAWVAARLLDSVRDRLAGAVFVAPAPDFTEELMLPSLSASDREALATDGKIAQASQYSDEPTILTQKLFDDGRDNLVLNDVIRLDAPVRILQGMNDPDVPYTHALKFAEKLSGNDVSIGLTKSGDHRLSEPADLARLISAIASINA